MASLQGPTPKLPQDRARGNKDALTPGMTIYPDGVTRGRALPSGIVWCSRTKAWWKTWRESPQAQLMGATDWEAMLEAAIIHNKLWTDRETLKPAEIATLTKQLHSVLQNYGMSYGDRLKLRVKLDNDGPNDEFDGTDFSVPDNVIDLYRQRLA